MNAEIRKIPRKLVWRGERFVACEAKLDSTFLLWSGSILILLTALALGLTHRFFLAGTESDFLGSYLREATRFLSGRPLEVNPHPPLYSIVIALAKELFHDWLLTGKLVSLFSTLLVILINVCLFEELAGFPAAAGVLLAFAHCFNFLYYSALATSDVFFFMLYSAALYACFKYSTGGRLKYLFLAGLAVGLSFITRENAITLFLVFLVPLLSVTGAARVKHVTLLAFGCLIPIGLWYVFSRVSRSPFYPSKTYVNLAMTYFSKGNDRISADAYAEAEKRFHNLYQVFAFSPRTMFVTYAHDLIRTLFRVTSILTGPIIGVLGIAGVRSLINASRKPFAHIFLIATVAQLLLVNFKTYEHRYYFFLLPLLGGTAGCLLYRIAAWASKANPQTALLYILLPLFLSGLILNGLIAYKHLHPPFENELADAVAAIRPLVPSGSVVFARKENIPFYTDARFQMLPNVSDIGSLRDALGHMQSSRTFVYFGSYESALRPGLRQLINAKNTPSWLKPRADAHSRGVSWHFYEVVPVGG